ncbi:MAG: protein-L-isoaspartate(D-aspartate) O-methyltransferase [Alphaproteobacteria bacterium]
MTDANEQARRYLLDEIAREVAATRRYVGITRLSPAVVAALETVPREEFVPDDLRHLAYQNRPLSIGQGQTISQPYIVAIMTELAALTTQSHVLEIGTGCGYQAAVLAEIAKTVVTVERIASLAGDAKALLKRLGYDNVTVIYSDGGNGWPAEAPYDAILVTAAAATLPTALLDQLRPGGRMVIPLGRQDMTQSLVVMEKDAETGKVRESCNLPVAFVPLLGGLN